MVWIYLYLFFLNLSNWSYSFWWYSIDMPILLTSYLMKWVGRLVSLRSKGPVWRRTSPCTSSCRRWLRQRGGVCRGNGVSGSSRRPDRSNRHWPNPFPCIERPCEERSLAAWKHFIDKGIEWKQILLSSNEKRCVEYMAWVTTCFMFQIEGQLTSGIKGTGV